MFAFGTEVARPPRGRDGPGPTTGATLDRRVPVARPMVRVDAPSRMRTGAARAGRADGPARPYVRHAWFRPCPAEASAGHQAKVMVVVRAGTGADSGRFVLSDSRRWATDSEISVGSQRSCSGSGESCCSSRPSGFAIAVRHLESASRIVSSNEGSGHPGPPACTAARRVGWVTERQAAHRIVRRLHIGMPGPAWRAEERSAVRSPPPCRARRQATAHAGRSTAASDPPLPSARRRRGCADAARGAGSGRSAVRAGPHHPAGAGKRDPARGPRSTRQVGVPSGFARGLSTTRT